MSSGFGRDEGTGTILILALADRRGEWKELCRLGGRDRAVLRELEREWWIELAAEEGLDDVVARGPDKRVGESGLLELECSILFLLGVSMVGEEGSDEMAESVGETHFSVVWESTETVDGDRDIS